MRRLALPIQVVLVGRPETINPPFHPPAGEYGLRNKREVWRVKFTLAKIRKAARELLTLDEKDPRRLFEGVCVVVPKGWGAGLPRSRIIWLEV